MRLIHLDLNVFKVEEDNSIPSFSLFPINQCWDILVGCLVLVLDIELGIGDDNLPLYRVSPKKVYSSFLEKKMK